MSIIPKNLFGDADIGGWNPKSSIFNMLLNIPDLQNRAIAQLLSLGTIDNAEWWLGLSEAEQIAQLEHTVLNQRGQPITYVIPTFPSSVYIPYLNEYAECVLAGTLPSDENVLNLYNIDESRFGGVADYTTPAASYTDNYPAFLAAYNAGIDSGQGFCIYVPSNSARYVSRLPQINPDFCTILSSDRSARLITEEFSAPYVFADFDSNDVSHTTQVGCGMMNLTIEGFDPDYLSTAQKNARQRKTAIRTMCTSHFNMYNVFVKNWYTGSTAYGSQGGSIGLESRGKEFTQVDKMWFYGDCPVKIRRNTKELSSFDLDQSYFRDCDFRMVLAGATRYGDEQAFHVDGDGNVELHECDFGVGNTNIAGGAGMFKWDTSAATRDSSGIRIGNGRGEQGSGTGAWNVYISSSGTKKVSKVLIQDLACDIAIGGIYLNGVVQSKISGGSFPRGSLQTTSPVALELAAGTGFPDGVQDITIEDFYIPDITGQPNAAILYDFNGQTVKFTTSTQENGKNQLDSLMLVG
jgi:hypothetical protein